ncbi:hypothetical protein [Hymenobacter sp. B81]|uniref:sodium:solute symporter family transporter n=1 Tax=Hymenobacter sp. B81 TaxID=3344878 RepID=UPI0037DDABE9
MQRTRAGLPAARGRQGGCPAGLAPRYQKIAPAVKGLYEAGQQSTRQLIDYFQIGSRRTLYKIGPKADAGTPESEVLPYLFNNTLIGVLLFVFYLFHPAPLTFNRPIYEQVLQSPDASKAQQLERHLRTVQAAQQQAATDFVSARHAADPARQAAAQRRLQDTQNTLTAIRTSWQALVKRTGSAAEAKDTDYVFITFVLQYLPRGLVGLLVGVVLSAAMSGAAAGLNALGSTTLVDLYRPFSKRPVCTEAHLVRVSRWATMGWGVLGVGFALFAVRMENLIQAVNIIDSLFYGIIPGIFAVAFFQPKVGSRAVFCASVVTQIATGLAFWLTDIAYLWYNVLGCLAVMLLAMVLERIFLAHSRFALDAQHEAEEEATVNDNFVPRSSVR